MSDKPYWTVTPAAFWNATGVKASQDDLERCNCKDHGEVGHWYCGWCEPCNKPRFVCGHHKRNLTEGTLIHDTYGYKYQSSVKT